MLYNASLHQDSPPLRSLSVFMQTTYDFPTTAKFFLSKIIRHPGASGMGPDIIRKIYKVVEKISVRLYTSVTRKGQTKSVL